MSTQISGCLYRARLLLQRRRFHPRMCVRLGHGERESKQFVFFRGQVLLGAVRGLCSGGHLSVVQDLREHRASELFQIIWLQVLLVLERYRLDV